MPSPTTNARKDGDEIAGDGLSDTGGRGLERRSSEEWLDRGLPLTNRRMRRKGRGSLDGSLRRKNLYLGTRRD